MSDEQTKFCSRCKTIKNISEFSKNRGRKGDLRCWCRQCANKYQRDRRKTIPKEVKYKKDREQNLWYKYGLSITEYNYRFNEQNGYCPICGKHQSELKKALVVDHNHITGRVRGLLCGKCNSVLGYFDADNKNFELFINAVDYLKGDRYETVA